MNDIKELKYKLLPIVDATTKLAIKHFKITALKEAMNNLQLAMYWLETAENQYQEIAMESETLSIGQQEQPVLPNFNAPTLLGTLDHFEFIKAKLNEFNQDLWYYKETVHGTQTRYQLERGYDKLMDTHFNIKQAEMYYEAINNR